MKQRVIDYINEFGSITTFQAFTDLGCTRLSEYIRQIREERKVSDRTLKRKNRYGELVWFKEYFFEEE